MKVWVPVASLLVGFLCGFVILTRINLNIPIPFAPYLSVAALTGLDTLFGGVRASIEGRFQNDIFMSGFVLNTLLAGILVYFGSLIGIDFALVAVLVLGSRIFLNLSLVRRYYINKLAMERSRAKEELEAAQAISSVSVAAQKSEIGGNI